MWAEQTHIQPPAFDVHVTDLPGGQLGLAWGHTIALDVNASGHGWLSDSTWERPESFLSGYVPASDRMDLLTVVSHELGHLLGYKHDTDLRDVMAATLSIGTRRLPGIAPVTAHATPEPAFVSLLLHDQVDSSLFLRATGSASADSSNTRTLGQQATDILALLLPVAATNYVGSPQTGLRAIDARILNDITDEETELLDEDLLDLIATSWN